MTTMTSLGHVTSSVTWPLDTESCKNYRIKQLSFCWRCRRIPTCFMQFSKFIHLWLYNDGTWCMAMEKALGQRQ